MAVCFGRGGDRGTSLLCEVKLGGRFCSLCYSTVQEVFIQFWVYSTSQSQATYTCLVLLTFGVPALKLSSYPAFPGSCSFCALKLRGGA